MASLHLHVVKMYTRPKMFKLYSDPCVNMRYMVAQYSTQAQACLGYIRKLIADDNNHKVFHHVDMYITHIVTESIMYTLPVPVFKKKILEHSNVKDSLIWTFLLIFCIYLPVT